MHVLCACVLERECVYVCVCMHVLCACVLERERVFMCVCVCVCVTSGLCRWKKLRQFRQL